MLDANTRRDIIRAALSALTLDPANLRQESPAYKQVDDAIDSAILTVLEMHAWKFAKKSAKLIGAKTVDGVVFELPTDFVRFVEPLDSNLRFEGNYILTGNPTYEVPAPDAVTRSEAAAIKSEEFSTLSEQSAEASALSAIASAGSAEESALVLANMIARQGVEKLNITDFNEAINVGVFQIPDARNKLHTPVSSDVDSSPLMYVGYISGDLYQKVFDVNGVYFRFNSGGSWTSWITETLRGPQGEQGPQGPQGPQGLSGTANHNLLTNRDIGNQHTMGAITGLDSALARKQEKLVSGSNIKTINGQTVLGNGDLVISGGGGGGTSDHNLLTNRNMGDQHTMGAITGLNSALASKQDLMFKYSYANDLDRLMDFKEIYKFENVSTLYNTPPIPPWLEGVAINFPALLFNSFDGVLHAQLIIWYDGVWTRYRKGIAFTPWVKDGGGSASEYQNNKLKTKTVSRTETLILTGDTNLFNYEGLSGTGMISYDNGSPGRTYTIFFQGLPPIMTDLSYLTYRNGLETFEYNADSYYFMSIFIPELSYPVYVTDIMEVER